MLNDDAKTPDRRARRTRRLLKEALFALILEKGYDAVTIEDITERADLGRTTFYLHYHDKEDLLLQSIDAIVEDLLSRLPLPSWAAGGAHSPESVIRDAVLITFQHAAENAQLYRVINRGGGANKAVMRIHNIISQKARELIQLRARSTGQEVRSTLPLDVFANYFAGSLLALVTWWLEADTPYSPEQMADMFRLLFFEGGRKALGVE